MQDFGKFLVENWQSILGAFLCAVSVAIQIFKKRPEANGLWKILFSYTEFFLTSDINEAESKFVDGVDKKDFVLQKALDYVSKFIKLDQSSINDVKVYVGHLIEGSLSTPMKKD